MPCFGTISSADITPDPETGIGAWTEEQFYRAMHEELAADGRRLYPAFPYPWFTKMTREDVDDIRAYLRTLAPVRAKPRDNEFIWPLDHRFAMAAWNGLFFKPGEFQPGKDQSAEWNRGAYLVEGLGDCGACHTPTNILGSSKTQAIATFLKSLPAFTPNSAGQCGSKDAQRPKGNLWR